MGRFILKMENSLNVHPPQRTGYVSWDAAYLECSCSTQLLCTPFLAGKEGCWWLVLHTGHKNGDSWLLFCLLAILIDYRRGRVQVCPSDLAVTDPSCCPKAWFWKSFCSKLLSDQSIWCASLADSGTVGRAPGFSLPTNKPWDPGESHFAKESICQSVWALLWLFPMIYHTVHLGLSPRPCVKLDPMLFHFTVPFTKCLWAPAISQAQRSGQRASQTCLLSHLLP